ncbi:PAS domain S-box protein [Bizionia sediminis]|uniref:histidine kinase n=1 Tax=Bizionia sediminis TaxID=1737064 RepID=A0ABW5KSB9_9FLAO
MPSNDLNSYLDDPILKSLDFIETHAIIGRWEYYPDKDLLTWSKNTKRIHEVPDTYTPDVTNGINFYKEGYSRQLVQTLFSLCLEKFESFDEELQIVTSKGTEKWVRVIGTPQVENGICTKVTGLFQDIDEKTKNTKLLALREKELRYNFEQAIIGMAILDMQGNWIKVNNSLCNMLGYTQAEFLKLSFMDITHPEDLSDDRVAFGQLVSGEITHYKTEKRYIHKNGNPVWIQLSSSVVKDKSNRPMHFIAQINDITESKKYTQRIQKLLETTEAQNERLLNFSHIVSHNLRSHCSNLVMLVDILKTDLPETTQNEIFPMVEAAVTNLRETIDNLNQVASINNNKVLNLEPINLLEIMNDVIKGVSGLILNSNAVVKVDIDPDIHVKGIAAYMDSILLNFLTNAIKYKQSNKPPQIEISASKHRKKVKIKFKDYGLGINLKRHANKLFGMYKTFHKHKDSRGLGLFITKNQILAMGGDVSVKSEENVGSTFIIELLSYP